MDAVLRAFIQELLLSEAAMSADAAGKGNIGLFQSDNGSKKTLVLFDTKAATQALKQARSDKATTEDGIMDRLEGAVVGFIQVKKPTHATRGAYTVSSSAAKNGVGPLLYDLAMTVFGKIAPDRMSVSPSAQGVWRYYFDKRSDVKKEPLDDVLHPKTPDLSDDAVLHDKGDQNPLNYTYEGAPADPTRLFLNGSRWTSSAEKLGFDANVVTRAMRHAGAGFFRQSFLRDD